MREALKRAIQDVLLLDAHDALTFEQATEALLKLHEPAMQVLEVTAGNIRSLGPAGALAPVWMPYREWLKAVESVISDAG